MNAKTVKKIRKAFNKKEVEMCNQIFEYFNSLSFFWKSKNCGKDNP